MIHGCKRLVGAADPQPALAETGKGLRRGHFVDEMQVNIKNSRGLGLFGNNVRIPDFLKECFWH